MLVYGYYPVRDTILLYPTKGLYSGQWISSQYGTPPLKIETPEVLERFLREEKNIEQFGLGTFDSRSMSIYYLISNLEILKNLSLVI